mmetsp:Transcript_88347/g.270371  ORF Transcript_88347/g.270371 Transcript_88347/m.270371 type:complete len:392 (-) Transcript_88347:85-1260(-)
MGRSWPKSECGLLGRRHDRFNWSEAGDVDGFVHQRGGQGAVVRFVFHAVELLRRHPLRTERHRDHEPLAADASHELDGRRLEPRRRGFARRVLRVDGDSQPHCGRRRVSRWIPSAGFTSGQLPRLLVHLDVSRLDCCGRLHLRAQGDEARETGRRQRVRRRLHGRRDGGERRDLLFGRRDLVWRLHFRGEGPLPRAVPGDLGARLLGVPGVARLGAAVRPDGLARQPGKCVVVPSSVACYAHGRLRAERAVDPQIRRGLHHGPRSRLDLGRVGDLRLRPAHRRGGGAGLLFLGRRLGFRGRRLRHGHAVLQHDPHRPRVLRPHGENLRGQHYRQHPRWVVRQPVVAVGAVRPVREGVADHPDVARVSRDLLCHASVAGHLGDLSGGPQADD